MSCAHGLAATDFETAFSVDASAITFGHGALAELGDHARSLGMARVALFTDPRVRALPFFDTAHRSLLAAGLDVGVFDEVKVEPTDASFLAAADFARQGRFDGHVSLGGGSVIDTCKAASLYATYPAPFLAYVNAPIGEARPVPGPLPPHIACPTTAGTGSETTAIAVCDILSLAAKTGIVSKRLRPTLALIDPSCTATLPASVGRRRLRRAIAGVLHGRPLHRAPPPRLARAPPRQPGPQPVERSRQHRVPPPRRQVPRPRRDRRLRHTSRNLSADATLRHRLRQRRCPLPHAPPLHRRQPPRLPPAIGSRAWSLRRPQRSINASVFLWTFRAVEHHLDTAFPRRRSARSPHRRRPRPRRSASPSSCARPPPSPTASPESATPKRPISTLADRAALQKRLVDNAPSRPTSRDDLRAHLRLRRAPSTPSELHQENAHGRAPKLRSYYKHFSCQTVDGQ
ncbi:MAG: iron-containing alcohol dehydrogenase [Polyangiaceae bacterium]